MIKTKLYTLILFSAFSGSLYANQVTSDVSRDFTECFNADSSSNNINNWSEVSNFNNLRSCFEQVTGRNDVGQENITNYLRFNQQNSRQNGCDGGLFISRLGNNSGTFIRSHNFERGSINQFNLNESCLFFMPNGNEGQSVTLNNRNSNTTCSGTFSCNNNNWSASGGIRSSKNVQYCNAIQNYTITNPIYQNDTLTNYYINSRTDFNSSGQKRINIPSLTSNTTDPTRSSNEIMHHYSYTYGGYHIRHSFSCNNNLNIVENETEIEPINACVNINNIPQDIDFTITGVSENPSNGNIRPISCSLNSNMNQGGISSNPLRNNIISKISETNSNGLLIFETTTQNLNIQNAYGFYRSDDLAIFQNNVNSGKAIVGCLDKSGWRVLSGSCSNIRNRACFNLYSELNHETANNIVRNPITTADGVLDYNPKKRRLPNGDFTEDYLIYNFVGQSGNPSFCFEYEALNHESF